MENGHAEQRSAGPTLQAIKYSRGKLGLLDQRKLPHESIYLDIPDTPTAWHAIKDMVVRGAPAIAIAAALALAVELVKKQQEFDSAAAVQTHVHQQLDYLVSSRPTAVNLSDAAEKLKKLASDAAVAASASASGIVEAVVAEAEQMLEDDVASNKRIGRFGADAIIAAVQKSRGKKQQQQQQQQQNGSNGTSSEGLRVMTHCNTGSLATAAFGTALGVIRTLYADGALKKAICTETRPYNQGSRLTAFELVHDGIPATLIADSAAAYLQSSGGVDAIVVGADRVAANGDTANKVGTFSLALSAFHHGIPFFVAAPLTSVDTAIPSGEHIVVEERDPKELTHALGGQGPQVAPNGIGVWNPSFDITPARVITGIITEQGVISKTEDSDEFDIPAFVRALKADNTATKPAAAAAAAAAAAKFTSFEPLSEEKVVQYLQSRPDLAKRLGGSAESWTSKEVGDGNINFVYIVKGPEGSLVLKQALPYIRCVGESWPMTLERIGFEAAALQEEFRVVPQHVPEVYSYDRPMAAVAMEYLPPPHIILRKGLISGLVYPHLSEHVSTFLAQTLFATSLLNVSTTTFRQEVARYCRNVEMCRLTEQVIFTEPYTLAKNNRWTSPQLDDDAKAVREDSELKVAVAELKAKFCEKAEALIHADLHTGSIMATPESTKVIDPEFAFYGPMGFDIGAFLGNLLLAYFSQDGHAKQTSENRTDFKRWLLSAVVATWTLFEDKFVDLWNAAAKEDRLGDLYPGAVFAAPLERIAAQKAYMRTLLSDSLGFAGAKMIRRIVGIAHVEDMESIEDADERAKCERRALNFGKRLVKERSAFDGIAAVAAAAAAALE